MKKIPLYLSGFVLLLLLKPLLVELFSADLSSTVLGYVFDIVVRVLIAAYSLWLIYKSGYPSFNGLEPRLKISNLQVLILPLLICIYFISRKDFNQVEAGLVLAFILSCTFTGVAEELFFRGLIFPAFFSGRKNAYLAAILSSVVFGLVHFINLFRQPDNFSGILSQAIFAFSIGVYFSGLLIRTGSIFIPVLVHALVNIAFSGFARGSMHSIKDAASTGDQITTWVIFSLIFLSGIFMIRLNLDKFSVAKKIVE